jgi:predicted Zn-dependent peptidase
MVYAGTAPARVTEVLDVIDDQVAALLADGVTEQELTVAMGYLEGSLLLGLEDSGSRMGRLGRSQLSRGEVVPVDEHLARIRAVECKDVSRVLHRVLAAKRSLAIVGPFNEDDFANAS